MRLKGLQQGRFVNNTGGAAARAGTNRGNVAEGEMVVEEEEVVLAAEDLSDVEFVDKVRALR